jgi:hypothetical protein
LLILAAMVISSLVYYISGTNRDVCLFTIAFFANPTEHSLSDRE